MIKYIIDRFENDWAIIETSKDPIITFNLPKNLLPREAKEGYVLNIRFTINKEETLKRKRNQWGLLLKITLKILF